MLGDELFARLNGFIKAEVKSAGVPGLAFSPGDFAIPHEAPSIHTAPTDFTYSATDTPGWSGLSVEQKVQRDALGAVRGEFSVTFAGKDYAQSIALRDIVIDGVRAFITSLQGRDNPVYAEIESIGRPDADLPDNTPFVREVRVAIEYRADNQWR